MKKIMVVDDDKDLLANMKAFLRKEGYEVAVTTSCDEGSEILHSFQPDLIFLDINVGDDDGREMCKKIKAQAEYEHVPVILISANHEALKLYKDCGANSFINKPFPLSSVGNTVRDYLSSE
jgi:DNA-binding response OmpR family regulator